MFERVKELWGNFKDYWYNNLKENYKTVSKSFGSLLVVLVVEAIPGFVALANGDAFGFAAYLGSVLGTFGLFWAILMTSVFGKQDADE
jgi:hypothetical protein